MKVLHNITAPEQKDDSNEQDQSTEDDDLIDQE